MSLPPWLQKTLPAVILLIMVLAFVSVVSPIAYHNTQSSEWDQRDYLKLGLWGANGRSFSDGNRHPLYPLLLAPIAQRNITFFTQAKLLSIALGGIGLWGVYAIAKRHVGQWGGLLVVALLLSNSEYRQSAGHVDVETLLVPLFLAAWHFGGTAVSLSSQKPTLTNLMPSVLTGLFIGLCYLAKGTGMVLAITFIGVNLLIYLANKWRTNDPSGSCSYLARHLAGFLLSFGLVALPLWIHNIIHYHNPFYNVNTTHFMWLDSWEESYVYGPSDLPTLTTYLQNHKIGEIMERLWNGIQIIPRQWYTALHLDGLPVASWAVYGMLLPGILLAAGAAKMTKFSSRFWFTAVLLTIFAFLFAWYHPISNHPRFILPLSPILYLSVVWCITQLTQHSYRFMVLATAVSLLLSTFPLVNNFHHLPLLSTMAEHDRQNNEPAIAIMQTILTHTQPGQTIVTSPGHAQAEWLAYDRTALYIPHIRQNWASFATWLYQKQVNYVVLDTAAWERRQLLLDDYWVFTDQGFTPTQPPPGWSLLQPTTYPCKTCLFEIDQQIYEPETAVSLQYATTFQLTGYTLQPALLSPNTPFTLILHWQLLTPLQNTTHIFVHILDESGTIIAQHDTPLLLDLTFHPQERFLAGTMARHEHLFPPLPPGNYSVHVGLYLWETRQRLPTHINGIENTYPHLFSLTIPP